ncbi:GDSL esterase/lipase At5g03610-like [Rhododendron vialii]|uniref:GDSL esterase/lipase At5g03610-like n=1 Tax=Rhododendron vialii TaxID=182163 RepID=UPI00265F4FAC|nr:GDSL esterase/lipase At5g03610-like [Rhododendron vialii]
MEKKNVILFFSSCFLLRLLSGIPGVQAGSSDHLRHHGINGFHPEKLFVFGDSYVDTGNGDKSTARSWEVPYGITSPGKPDGRYSDGRVLTDFLAKYLGLKSPIPYVLRKNAPKLASYGMNFAFGGTGVFDTLVSEPNMTTQIDFLQNLVKKSVYTKMDLESSLSLVSNAGNDYVTYLAEGGSNEGLPTFIARVVKQIAVNLKRIRNMGVGKVAIGALQPLGCLPGLTAQNSFRHCNGTYNDFVKLHNTLLRQAVAELNSESNDSGAFIVLDLYGSFNNVLNHKESNAKFRNLLTPCCTPTQTLYSCGSVDADGGKMYTLCDNPKATFFWDTFHPSQSGWRAVFSDLKSEFETS